MTRNYESKNSCVLLVFWYGFCIACAFLIYAKSAYIVSFIKCLQLQTINLIESQLDITHISWCKDEEDILGRYFRKIF